MPSSQRQSQWLHLLDLAIVAIDTLEGKYAWSLGGGTALALRIDHRVSFDIDLFFPDATALRLLSPHRNAVVRALSDTWQEPGHYLKIERPEGEIDFLCAALMTTPGTEPWPIGDRSIPLETPREVLAKKLYFRGNRLLARDLFDIAAVRRLAPEEFEAAIAAAPDGARRAADILRRRGKRLKAELPQAVRPTAMGKAILDIDILDLAAALDR